jgi:F0F1-type ATP synthase assembly protein I
MANRTGPTVTTFEALAVAGQFGITLVVSVVLGYFAGHWLDDRLNTGIIFTLIGVLLGLVAAVLNTLRLYTALMRKSETERLTQSAPTMESVRRANEGNTLDEDQNEHL